MCARIRSDVSASLSHSVQFMLVVMPSTALFADGRNACIQKIPQNRENSERTRKLHYVNVVWKMNGIDFAGTSCIVKPIFAGAVCVCVCGSRYVIRCPNLLCRCSWRRPRWCWWWWRQDDAEIFDSFEPEYIRLYGRPFSNAMIQAEGEFLTSLSFHLMLWLQTNFDSAQLLSVSRCVLGSVDAWCSALQTARCSVSVCYLYRHVGACETGRGLCMRMNGI